MTGPGEKEREPTGDGNPRVIGGPAVNGGAGPRPAWRPEHVLVLPTRSEYVDLLVPPAGSDGRARLRTLAAYRDAALCRPAVSR
ncbi:MAG: hypothetical protein ACYCYA_13255 [Actinomycetes bacterium]